MISSELIDYVKAQLAAGATREKITTDLLGQGGWTQAQVNEAFLAADQKMPTLQSPEADPKLTQVPTSIKYFEWLMYASLLGNTAIWLFEFATNVLQTNLTMIYAVPVISILIKLLLVYLVVYRRVNGARSALTILVMLGLFGATGLILTAISNPLLLIAALPSIFEIAAIYFVFKKDSNAWLTKTQTITVQDDTGNVVKVLAAPEAKKGNIWNKTIPRTNKTSLIVASTFFIFSVFVFGGGLSVFNDSTLGVFAHMMLVTMIVFAGFVLLENFVFRKLLRDSTSSLIDSVLMILISVRNFMVILSVVPFIQLAGMAAIVTAGIPWLVLYVILLSLRFRKSISTKTTV